MLKKTFKEDDSVTVTIKKWSLGKSAVKGTKFVQVNFTSGITWKGYHAPKSTKKMMETLEIMGFKGASLADLQYDNALDISKEYVAVIQESREYEGNTYYDAKWINNLWSPGFDKKSKSLLNEFDIDTRAYITDAVSMEEANTTSASEFPAESAGIPAGEPTQTFTADDIPF